MRPHVAAVYAFARTADDIADEAIDAGRRAADAARRVADGACTRPSPSNGRTPRQHAHEDADCGRARPFDPVARSPDAAVRRSRERVRSGYHDDPIRLVGRASSTTAADRANPVGRLRAPHRRLSRRARSTIVGCALHRPAADRLSGRTSAATGSIGRLYVPRDVERRLPRARDGSRRRRSSTTSWAAAIRQCVDQTRAQFEAGRAVCDAWPGGCATSAAAPGCAVCGSSSRSSAAGPALKARRPAIGARDMPALLWRAARWPPSAS